MDFGAMMLSGSSVASGLAISIWSIQKLRKWNDRDGPIAIFAGVLAIILLAYGVDSFFSAMMSNTDQTPVTNINWSTRTPKMASFSPNS